MVPSLGFYHCAKHFINWRAFSLTALILVVKKIQKGILKWAEGTNIFQNNGKSSGQIVNHVHFHIVPRFEGDGVKLAESETFEYNGSELPEMQEKIKKLLNEG